MAQDVGAAPMRPDLFQRPGDRAVPLCAEGPGIPVGRKVAAQPQGALSLDWVPAMLSVYANTGYPSGANDGAVWQGKGVSAQLGVGLQFQWGILSAAFVPGLAWQQNAAFPMVPTGLPGNLAYSNPYYGPCARRAPALRRRQLLDVDAGPELRPGRLRRGRNRDLHREPLVGAGHAQHAAHVEQRGRLPSRLPGDGATGGRLDRQPGGRRLARVGRPLRLLLHPGSRMGLRLHHRPRAPLGARAVRRLRVRERHVEPVPQLRAELEPDDRVLRAVGLPPRRRGGLRGVDQGRRLGQLRRPDERARPRGRLHARAPEGVHRKRLLGPAHRRDLRRQRPPAVAGLAAQPDLLLHARRATPATRTAGRSSAPPSAQGAPPSTSAWTSSLRRGGTGAGWSAPVGTTSTT